MFSWIKNLGYKSYPYLPNLAKSLTKFCPRMILSTLNDCVIDGYQAGTVSVYSQTLC